MLEDHAQRFRIDCALDADTYPADLNLDRAGTGPGWSGFLVYDFGNSNGYQLCRLRLPVELAFAIERFRQ